MNLTGHACAGSPDLIKARPSLQPSPAHALRARIILSALLFSALLAPFLSADPVALPYVNDFEAADGYTLGPLLSDPDWYFDSQLSVAITSESALGNQSLSFAGSGWLSLDSDPASLFSGYPVTWLDFYLKPRFADTPQHALPALASLSGLSAGIGFIQNETTGAIHVFAGDGQGGGQWLPARTGIPLLQSESAQWLRLTYRLDYVAKRWDLFVDGQLQKPDIGFIDPTLDHFEGISLQGATGPTHFDAFYIGADNPLYADTSGDGLPDAWLIAHGLNPAISQRGADPDHDGLSNLLEYLLGTNPTQADTDHDGVSDLREQLRGSNPLLAEAHALGLLPFAESFETDTPGPFADGTRLWRLVRETTGADSSAEILTSPIPLSDGGSRYLQLAGSGIRIERNFAPQPTSGDSPSVWLDFRLQAASRSGAPEISADVAAVFYLSENDTLMALDGNAQGGGTWHGVAAAKAGDWHRLTLHLDYTTQRWSLWFNGVRHARDFGFARPVPYFSGFVIQHSEQMQKLAALDDLQVTLATGVESEPADLDNDGDGLTNAQERLLGTDPNNPDTDADGIRDNMELALGLDPLTPEGMVSKLVDEGNGSWAWRTQFSTAEGYQAGPLDGQLGWQATGEVSLDNEEAVLRAPDADTPAMLEHLVGAHGIDRIWLSFRAKMNVGRLPDPATLTGKISSLFGYAREGKLSIYDTSTARWLEHDVARLASSAGEWNDYTLFLDYRAHKWLLALNGRLVARDIGFRDTDLTTLARIRMIQEGADPETVHEARFDDIVVGNTEPADLDYDADGLTNAQERLLGTDPFTPDTDGDGIPDNWELAHGLNPLDPKDAMADPDQDGFSNAVEFQYGLNPAEPDPALAGYAHWDEWQGLSGSATNLLTADPRFPNAPDFRGLLPGLEIPANRGTNYGTRLRAWIIPPVSGEYTFWIAADDSAELWLSTDETPFARRRIAQVAAYTGVRQWEKYPETQRSLPLSLQAGVRYYIEVLHKQGSGSGHAAVAWQPPGDERTVIGGNHLEAFPRFANDQDEDGLPDDWELANGLDPAKGSGANGYYGDRDGDGLSNADEYRLGLNASLVDSDGDGVSDFAEIEFGTDPLDPDSHSSLGVPAPWVAAAIGGKDFQWVAQSGDKVILRTQSTPFGGKSDAGGILYQPVEGNFMCDGEIYFPDTTRGDLSGGLMVRDSLEKEAAFVSITRLLNGGWQVRHRPRNGSRVLTHNLPANTLLNYNHFAARRVGSVVSLYGETVAGLPRKLADYPVQFSGTGSLVGYVAWTDSVNSPGAVMFTLGSVRLAQVGDGLPAEAGLGAFDSVRWMGEWDGLASPESGELSHEPILDELSAVGALSPVLVSGTGAEASPVQGPWIASDTAQIAQDRRGELAWAVQVPAGGLYLVEFTGREANTRKTLPSRFPLKLFVDGQYAGTRLLEAGASQAASVLWFSPWLTAGGHTFHIIWDGAADYTRLQADTLALRQLGGDDADENGVPDWADRRLHLFNGIDAESDTLRSAVSPLPIEGRARWPQLTALTLGADPVPVHAGAGYRWYAQLPLNGAATLPLEYSGESGAVRRSLSVEWVAHDVFAGGTLAIRAGSTLRVKVQAEDGESVTLTKNGAAVTLAAGGLAELTFSTAGTYRLVGTASGGNVTREGETIVQVFAAPSLPDALPGMVMRERVLARPALPAGVTLQADPRLELATPVNNAAQMAWLPDDNVERRMVARIGTDGPVLAGVSAPGTALYANLETHTRLVETLPDGTQETETLVIMSPVRPDYAIKLEIIVAGVVFADGTRTQVLESDDLDALGQARVRILRPPGATTSVCHRTQLLHNGTAIGTK